MSPKFLNKFILSFLLKRILLVNLVYSFYWRTEKKILDFRQCQWKSKHFLKLEKAALIELVCCTARWRWTQLQTPPPPGQCPVPCRAVLSPVWPELYSSVTVISFLQCSYPFAPLDKQVNNNLGLSKAFSKDWHSEQRGGHIQSFPSPLGFFSRNASELMSHPAEGLFGDALKSKYRMQLGAHLRCSVINTNGHAGQLLWIQRRPESNSIFKMILLWLLY